MSKQKQEESTPLMEAPATAAQFGGGIVVKGKDDTQINLSRVAIFQGTAEEEQMYGEHKRGVFLDTLEVRELGNTIKIMPVLAFATWAKWVKGSKAPVETWTDQKDVPPEMLEWQDEGGKRVPPEAQEVVNVVGVVEGEQWPYLLQFKRTGLKCWNKTIAPLEARRAATGKCPGRYTLGSVDDQNTDGKPYKRLTATPAGEPTAKMTELALKVYTARAAMEQKAKSDSSDFNPDAPV